MFAARFDKNDEATETLLRLGASRTLKDAVNIYSLQSLFFGGNLPSYDCAVQSGMNAEANAEDNNRFKRAERIRNYTKRVKSFVIKN